MPNCEIALLTDARYVEPTQIDGYIQNILDDDALLTAALKTRGINAVRVDWADPTFDWRSVELAVIRTTWDYFERIDEFSGWLNRIESLTPLCNPIELIRWNMDKRYLCELASRGVSVPETKYLKKGDKLWLDSELRNAGEVIVKPAIAGAGRHCYRVGRDNLSEVEATVNRLLESEAFLVQPFLKSLLETGETSVMVFGGTVTHAVRKIGKPGDFRIHDDHGGKVYPYQPSPEEVVFAERVVAQCQPAPAYARVDIVRDKAGGLTLMELEVIEPELFLRFHPESAQLFADEIAKRVR